MTDEQLNQLINLLASVTLFEMMVAIGLGVTFADVWHVATDWRLVSKAVVASYVCVPAAAVALLILFQADPFVAAGLLIVAVCPGAPYGPPFTGIARGNVAVSVGLMVILAGSSALLAPALLQALLSFVLPFLGDTAPLDVEGGKIVVTLLVAQFLPLCIGLTVRQWRPGLADRISKPAKMLSTVLNLTLLGLIVYAQFDMLIGVPLRGYVGLSALVAASMATGWLFGNRDNRSAMVMATSVRNVGVCLVIVTSAFAGTRAVAAVTVFALFQTIVMALVAMAWGRIETGTKPMTIIQPASDAAPSGGAH